MKRLGSLTVFEGSKSQRTGGNEPTTSEESKTHRQSVLYRTALFTAKEQHCGMRKNHKPASNTLAEVTIAMARPRLAASVSACSATNAAVAVVYSPKARPCRGRTVAESRRIEEAHAAREFALNVCEAWRPPGKRPNGIKRLH